MVDTRKSSTENSSRELRSGRTSAEGNTPLKLFKVLTLNLLHLIPNFDSDFCQNSTKIDSQAAH